MGEYWSALGTTLVVEVPVYVLLLGWLGWRLRIRAGDSAEVWAGRVVVGTGVSLATQPLVWWTLRWADQHWPTVFWVASAEVAVVAIEAVLVTWACRRRRADLWWAVLVSLVANMVSLAVGLAVP